MADLQVLVGKSQYTRGQIMPPVAAISRQVTSEGLGISESLGAGDPAFMAIVFAWTAVGGVQSYQLEIGTVSGDDDYAVVNTGNVLTYVYHLPPGTYYTRVKGVTNGTPGSASVEQQIFV